MTATTPERARPLLAGAEVSLTALTCAAGFGLVRLFEDASIVPKVLASAVAAHTVAALCRRRGLGSGASALVATVGLVVVVPWIVLPGTTAFGLPTADTLDVARTLLADAWTQFGEVKAPAPTLPGFVLAAAIGVWGLAFLADTAAFRAAALFEAMVPASTLFVFGAALGAPRDRILCTGLFLGSLLAFWLTASAHRQVSSPAWMERGESSGTRAIVRTGAALGGLAVAAAVLLGPNLPGADAQAVIPWRSGDRDEGSSRVTVSPLVDIRTRMVDQAATEVFRVRTSERSYWRLTALETFDGTIWSSSRRYGSAGGRLGSAVPEDARPSAEVVQQFAIIALDSFWLPAAFRPVAIDGVSARYDAESHSLLTEADNAIGQRYEVTSSVPRLDAGLLAGAPDEIPAAVAETYLALPPGFPDNVRGLAASVVAGATSPYDGAKRLQDFFRGGLFTYDLDVPQGHSDDALQRFLFETRRGYCEQFAGAYAAMARAVGLPARVGVGFTAGELGPDRYYSVRGYHGHAWPEVYLAGFGWVPFEPTPGRGIPGGEPYTGVAEEQAVPGQPNSATTLPTTTTLPSPQDPSAPTTLPDLTDLGGGEGGLFEEAPRPNPWPRRLLVAVAVLLGGPAAWVGGLALVRALVRLRRRTAARGNKRLDVAWDETREALARYGVQPRPSETPAEYAARASLAAALDPELLTGLADLTTVARYAPQDEAELDDETIDDALHVARGVRRQVRRKLDRRAQVRALVDPRPASAPRRA
ncbi:MAG TPA: DUF3488 and transglutaminase-like domain-containing protein [Acidimicrobiales bacterium]|nr:DUF3488 and transglutaminase-like domain-containing protein [Acidimicrobiales bacterium]